MSDTKGQKKTAKRSYMVRRPNPLAKQTAPVENSMGTTLETMQLPTTERFDDKSYQHKTEPAPLSSRLDFDGTDNPNSFRRGKPIAVARPVKEACNSKTRTGTFDSGAVTKLEPQTLAVGASAGARRDNAGDVMGYTILGDPHDFDDRLPEDQRQGRAPDAQSLTTAMLDGASGDYDDDDDSHGMSATGSVTSAKKSLRGGRRGSTMSKRSMKQGGGSTMGSLPGAEVALEGESDRQTRALELWDKYQRERDVLVSHLNEVRGPKDKRVPVMLSGDEYRERVEEFDLIEKAMPREDKYRDNLWFMSLRDSWARFIPLGSIFSGLFCVVQEKALADKAFTVVRDPTKPSMVNTKLQHTLARDGTQHSFNVRGDANSIPKSSWVNMEGIWQKEQYLGPNVKELLPFRVDTEGLMVTGSNGIDSVLPGEGLDDEYLDDEGSQPDSIPSRITRKGAATVKGEENMVGPGLELRDPNITFNSSPNNVAKQRVCVFNHGTAAVHYRWEKTEKAGKLGLPLRGSVPIGGGFWCCQDKGVLQPGMGCEFPFAFKSSLCGIYTSVWKMVTVPEMPETNQPLEVSMRGVVTAPDQNKVKRALLEQHLEHNAVLHGIQDAIMQAIRAVELPPPKAGASDQPPDAARLDAKKFAAANTEVLVKADVKWLRTLAVHYEPHMLHELQGLAESSNAFSQIGAQAPPQIILTEAEEAEAEMTAKLTPRAACYDPSLENNVPEADDSWDEEWSWDYKMGSLGERQLGIADETSRAAELAKLDSAVERAIWHQHRPSALYPPAVDALSELAENIEKAASQTRRRVGLAAKDFVAPGDEAEDPKAAKGKDKKGGAEEEAEEDDPELLADFHDMLYAKVRELLCNAVDQFSDLAGVVIMEEKERRGEGDDD